VRPCGLIGDTNISQVITVCILDSEAGVHIFLRSGGNSKASSSSKTPDFTDPHYTCVGEVAASEGVLYIVNMSVILCPFSQKNFPYSEDI